MSAPTLVATYSVASYVTSGDTKNISVTSQAGDILVVYGGTVDQFTLLNQPSGNSIVFTTQQAIEVANYCPAYIWTGVDNTGGTNWTLSCSTATSTIQHWGFSCLVFRNTNGLGNSARTNVASGAPSLNITTTQANSGLVVFNADWAVQDGASRTWLTVNSITPGSGNGLEKLYTFDSTQYSVYAAYYNDAGTAGSKTVGLSAPGSQKYSIVAIEVIGATAPSVTTNPVTNVGGSTATGNGTVTSDGGSTITERGVCWSTSANPTTSDNKATSPGTTGDFSVSITGLSDGTLYHARAYAINANGTSYGSDVTFQNYSLHVAWFTA